MKRALALLILLSASAPGGAQELGRLFFSPAERDALDARRNAKPSKPAAAAPPPETIKGYVTRSGGQATIWTTSGAIRSGAGVEIGAAPARAGASAAMENQPIGNPR